ncbi:hypothetical protein LPJ59_006108, partial [Coemansia sp. RSA 2399]
MDDVRRLLENKNYTKLDGSTVRLCMTPRDLARYKQIIIRGISAENDTEEKLFRHCKRYGMVCGIMFEENVARVWIETEEAATSALNNLGNSELFYGTSLEYVVNSSNDASENAPVEVVVTGKKVDHGGDNDYVHMISDDSDSDSSMVSVDMLRPPDPLTAFAMLMNKTRSPNNSPGHVTPNSTESGESSAQV